MHKNYKDCKLKGLILSAIRSGSNTAKTIHPAIGYPEHIDNLYSELHFLRRYGYITAKKVGRVSTYSLTKKGFAHALNPELFKIEKRNRFNKNLQNAIEDTLRDEEKVKEWAMKFAKEIAQHPVIEQINKPPDIIGGGHSVEFVDSPEYIKVQEAMREAGLPASIIQAHNYPEIILKLIKDYEERLERRDKRNQEPEQRFKPESVPAKYVPASNSSPISYPASQYFTQNYIGSDGKIHGRKVRMPKEPTQDELQRINERKKLVAYYSNYSLDDEFFRAWGNLRPYWIKGFGIVKKFQRGAVEILSPNNQEITKRDHTKGALNQKEILDAQFRIVGRQNDGIWIDGYGMKHRYFMKY